MRNRNIGKERITITVDKALLEWLDRKTAKKIFANRSHGIEYLINKAMEEEHEK